MLQKTCAICKEEKPITEFSPDKRGLYGVVSQCKKCRREYMANKRANQSYLEQEREKAREYESLRKENENRRAWRLEFLKSGKARKAISNWEQRNPGRRAAYGAVKYAVRTGKIPAPNTLKCCVDGCDNFAEHYHHENGYDKEHRLDVVPVCKTHHGKTRRK
jgi:hypothetical protein